MRPWEVPISLRKNRCINQRTSRRIESKIGFDVCNLLSAQRWCVFFTVQHHRAPQPPGLLLVLAVLIHNVSQKSIFDSTNGKRLLEPLNLTSSLLSSRISLNYLFHPTLPSFSLVSRQQQHKEDIKNPHIDCPVRNLFTQLAAARLAKFHIDLLPKGSRIKSNGW